MNLEARIDVPRAHKALQQKAGTHGEDKGEANLRRNQQASNLATRGSPYPPRCLLQRFAVIHSRALYRRDEPDQNSGRIAVPTVNSKIAGSKRKPFRFAISAGAQRTSSAVPHCAKITPAAPPAKLSRTLSVKSWHTIRNRDAPSAERTATSRRFFAACAKSRLAILAHEISRTTAVAPKSSHSAVLILPYQLSRNGRIVTAASGGYSFGNSRASCEAIEFISARAWLMLTPSFNRATA